LTRLRNLAVLVVAIALGVSIFLGLRTGSNAVSLQALAQAATPLDVALSNGKPTLMEFYADWCTTCQAMAEDMHSLKQDYGDRVNFVMLNVDNTRWLPEMLEYRVDGIPHFEFLDPQGEAIASAIGEQPRPIFAANLDALVAGEQLPYVRQRGRVSQVDAPIAPDNNADPRSHGSSSSSQF
jgi:thiol:disulfide interchange protein